MTATGCFRIRSRAADTGRAVLSATPPGGNATTMETGRVGYGSSPLAMLATMATINTAPPSARIMFISL
jgi:hypothetical protein